MLLIEIVILYFIYKDVGRLAKEKGYSSLRWRIHAFTVWFFGDMLGILIMLSYFPTTFYTINSNLGSALLVSIMGISMAYLFYLLLKKYWESLPFNPEDYD